jgi:hypothetical protein
MSQQDHPGQEYEQKSICNKNEQELDDSKPESNGRNSNVVHGFNLFRGFGERLVSTSSEYPVRK